MSSCSSSAVSEGTPSTSPTSQGQAVIGFMPRSTSTPTSAPMSRSTSQSSQAGFPGFTQHAGFSSWPYGSAHRRTSSSTPNSYVSDEDLFGDDDLGAYLSEAPAPPRTAEEWANMCANPPPAPPVQQQQQVKSRTSSIAVSNRRRTSSAYKRIS
jgi:hypothetical protein